MLVRIVKMSFKSDKVDNFLIIFNDNKEKIRNTNGCNFLELYRDKTDQNIFFTYSHWDTEQNLENYRNSNLFKNIWEKTKILFNDRPEAWSVDKVVSIE
ncbi:MAG: antibiotic biosynthesis monooxygenase [Flavobacteriaceae bacterium]|nr:antibiotic biosynthesis monooxygenase [Flavobacteriaceae bacterium]